MPAPFSIPLSLSIQYATPAPSLPRWRLRRWVEAALKGLVQASNTISDLHTSQNLPAGITLTLRLVDADEARTLNREYRNRDYATNVLTFEYGADPHGVWHGDIVLCVPVLVEEAQTQRKSLHDHAAHLCIHGVLHALGYDHVEAQDATTMEALEVAILARMNIANPYA